ncbi:MAG: GAF domain-containing protein [Chloroflexi bacterium]|nr:GAF domain-containing protein [Chloroflexota bacterium]MBI3732291.1 GAF domain-containing protein [Chloroflexota bacterium]
MTRLEWGALAALFVLCGLVGAWLWLLMPSEALPAGGADLLALVWLSALAYTAILIRRTHQREGGLQRQLRALRASLAQADTRAVDAEHLLNAVLETSAAPDLPHLARAVVDSARQMTGAEVSAFCLWDAQRRQWRVGGTSGESDAFDVSLRRLTPPDSPGRIKCSVIRCPYSQSHFRLPIARDGRVVGCLCVANQTAKDFSEYERALLEQVAMQAAVAVEQGRRLEQAGSTATTAERQRLAREIHDTFSQDLGFVNLKSATARELIAQGRPAEAQAELAQLSAHAQALYADARELLIGLRTETAPDHDLAAALVNYTRHLSQLSGVAITVDASQFDGLPLGSQAEVQLLRVVQEALSNVRKHAHARGAQVTLSSVSGSIRITVHDDGQGFDTARIEESALPHFGLQSMRERVESIGGTLRLESAHGQGTTVTIQAPLVPGESQTP